MASLTRGQVRPGVFKTKGFLLSDRLLIWNIYQRLRVSNWSQKINKLNDVTLLVFSRSVVSNTLVPHEP